jgi:hypothetical protein
MRFNAHQYDVGRETYNKWKEATKDKYYTKGYVSTCPYCKKTGYYSGIQEAEISERECADVYYGTVKYDN